MTQQLRPISPPPNLSVDLNAEKVNISIVLPMYNEEAVIKSVLKNLFALFEQLSKFSFEVIVVDDGSTDQSVSFVQEIGDPRLNLCRHPYNIGNGAAIKTGIRKARGNYILFMDADGQHRIEDIARLLEDIDAYDMIVGARTRESDTALHRDFANSLYNFFASYICEREIKDLTSGFRVIDAKLAKSLVYLLPNTFSYPTTMTLAVVRTGHSLKYIPIIVKQRVGKSKINLLVDGTRFFIIMLRIAVFFSPLKIFVPASVTLFGTGFMWYLYRVFVENRDFPPVSSLLMITAVIIFFIGLVSEQITYLRYERQ